MSNAQLKSLKVLKGTLEVVTGLRIGGSQETMEISGLDNPIIRNPANAEPFVPGSSIKGRLRSLAEWYFDEVPSGGDVIRPNLKSRTARVFGIPAQKEELRGPTRLIVRDAILSSTSRERFRNGTPITEVKSENSINRLTAMANPRPMERVLPGVSFECEFVYRVFSVAGDNGATDEANYREVFLVALALLEADALGGGSSRGNGKVRFDLTLDGQPVVLPKLSFPAPIQR